MARDLGDLVTESKTFGYVGTYVQDGLNGDEYRVEHMVPVGTGFVRRPLRHMGKHSPRGFCWGYHGSGPADLALSILFDATGGNVRLAWLLHQQFKGDVVAQWPQEKGWHLTKDQVIDWVAHHLSDSILTQYEHLLDVPANRIL